MQTQPLFQMLEQRIHAYERRHGRKPFVILSPARHQEMMHADPEHTYIGPTRLFLGCQWTISQDVKAEDGIELRRQN